MGERLFHWCRATGFVYAYHNGMTTGPLLGRAFTEDELKALIERVCSNG